MNAKNTQKNTQTNTQKNTKHTYLCRAWGECRSKASPHRFPPDTAGCRLWNHKYGVSTTGHMTTDTPPALTPAVAAHVADHVPALPDYHNNTS